MNFICEHTIEIPWLPCLFSMAKSVSSRVEQVNSITSNYVNSFIEAHGASNMIWNVRSIKLRMETRAFWEDIIPSSNKVFKDLESGTAERIWNLGNWNCIAVKSYVTVKYTAGFYILTLELQAR